MDHGEGGTLGVQRLATDDRIRIAIDPDDAATGGIQDGPAVTAATERGVDIDSTVPGLQGVDNLVKKNGLMNYPLFFHNQLSTARWASY